LALRGLPPLDRAVLMWRFGILGAPHGRQQIDRCLGLPRGTAYRAETRALAQLQRVLAETDDESFEDIRAGEE